MNKSNVCSQSIADMPVGFYGKVCAEVNGERHTWFIQSLVEATENIPVVDIALKDLDIYLDENAWFHGKNEPTIRVFIQHYERVDKADLSFPIILNSQFGVMDGLHRIAKAHVLGLSSVKAIILTELPEPDYIGEF